MDVPVWHANKWIIRTGSGMKWNHIFLWKNLKICKSGSYSFIWGEKLGKLIFPSKMVSTHGWDNGVAMGKIHQWAIINGLMSRTNEKNCQIDTTFSAWEIGCYQQDSGLKYLFAHCQWGKMWDCLSDKIFCGTSLAKGVCFWAGKMGWIVSKWWMAMIVRCFFQLGSPKGVKNWCTLIVRRKNCW